MLTPSQKSSKNRYLSTSSNLRDDLMKENYQNIAKTQKNFSKTAHITKINRLNLEPAQNLQASDNNLTYSNDDYIQISAESRMRTSVKRSQNNSSQKEKRGTKDLDYETYSYTKSNNPNYNKLTHAHSHYNGTNQTINFSHEVRNHGVANTSSRSKRSRRSSKVKKSSRSSLNKKEITEKLKNLEKLIKDLALEKVKEKTDKENNFQRDNIKHSEETLDLINKYSGSAIDRKIQMAVTSAMDAQNVKFDKLTEDYNHKVTLLDAYDSKLDDLQNAKLQIQEENHNLKMVISEYELETQNLKNLVKNMEGELDVVEELRGENSELIAAVKDIEKEMNVAIKESAEYQDIESRYLSLENENVDLKNELNQKKNNHNLECSELLKKIRELEHQNALLNEKLKD